MAKMAAVCVASKGQVRCVCLPADGDIHCSVHAAFPNCGPQEIGPEDAEALMHVECLECDSTGVCVECDGEGEHHCHHERCYDTHECGACDGSGKCRECRFERQKLERQRHVVRRAVA